MNDDLRGVGIVVSSISLILTSKFKLRNQGFQFANDNGNFIPS